MDPYDILLDAFKGLEPDERENLAWHAQAGTPILCGEEACWYTAEDGGG